MNTCLQPSCMDGLVDGDETDVDRDGGTFHPFAGLVSTVSETPIGAFEPVRRGDPRLHGWPSCSDDRSDGYGDRRRLVACPRSSLAPSVRTAYRIKTAPQGSVRPCGPTGASQTTAATGDWMPTRPTGTAAARASRARTWSIAMSTRTASPTTATRRGCSASRHNASTALWTAPRPTSIAVDSASNAAWGRNVSSTPTACPMPVMASPPFATATTASTTGRMPTRRASTAAARPAPRAAPAVAAV